MYFNETFGAEIFTEEVTDPGLQGEHGLIGSGLSQFL
jgi:hypothetical protein